MKFPLEIKPDRKFDVVGFGTNAVDYLITVPHFPQFNSKIELDDYTRLAGGEVATTLSGLARLGLKTAYVGSFGDDEAGRFGQESLQEEGVDLTYIKIVRGASTQIAFILIDKTTGERTVIWRRDPALSFKPEEIPEDLAGNSKILHLTPHDIEASIRFATFARENGTLVSIDADRMQDGLEKLLQLVDILVISRELALSLTGKEDETKALELIHETFRPAVSGITLGDTGSVVISDGRIYKTPAMPVPGGCRDTTGAGDAFRTGLLFGILNGEDIERTCRIANAVASLKCRKIGARTALPTLEELSQYI
jgi:sugar/nucleoside kinase (ribokinase family)